MGTPIIRSIIRDDERPITENISLRSALLAGFIVALNEPMSSSLIGRLTVSCGACDHMAICRDDFRFDPYSSGSFGPTMCASCRAVMITVGYRPSDNLSTMIFAIDLAGGVKGAAVDRQRIRLALEDLRLPL